MDHLTERCGALFFNGASINCAVVFLILLEGCSRTQEISTKQDFLELRFDDRGDRAHILLLTNGAARIDFTTDAPNKNGHQPLSVLLPAHSKEIERLATAIIAFDNTSVEKPNRQFAGARAQITIRCHVNGQDRSIPMLQYRLPSNRLWNGIVEEFKAVAQYDLARAIHDHEAGEAYLAAGDIDSAFREYDDAAKEFGDWESSFCERYADGIWEPGMNDRNNREYVLGDLHVRIAGGAPGPSFLMDSLQVNRDQAIDLARRRWKDYLPFDVAITQSGHVATVTYSAALIEFQEAGMPARIPVALTGVLRNGASQTGF